MRRSPFLLLALPLLGCQLLLGADPGDLVEDSAPLCTDLLDNDGDGAVDCDDLGCASFCVVCGDGRLADGEGCDDGNTSPGDGCDDLCQPEPSASFSAAQDLNGEQPDLATFAIFSQVLLEQSEPPDAAPDALGIFILASADPGLCALVTEAGGVNAFLDQLTLDRTLEGEFVVLFASVPGQTEVFLDQQVLNGQGNNPDQVRVDGGFLVNVGGVVLTDTILGGEGTGDLVLTEVSPTVLGGLYGGEMGSQFANDPNNPDPLIPPVFFQGEFRAFFCPGL